MYFKMKILYGIILYLHFTVFANSLLLPNTTGIDGQLTANLQVDNFFSLWLVFNNDDVKTSDKPFTILAPKNSAKSQEEQTLNNPELVRNLLLDHIVLGNEINISNSTSFVTLGNNEVTIKRVNDKLYANGAQILNTKVSVPNGILIILDNYLYHQENRNNITKNVDSLITTITIDDDKNNNDDNDGHDTGDTIKNKNVNFTFIDTLSQVLSYLKTGVRVFQHFLIKSNVSIGQLLKEDEEYTVFVPTDHAFQRWHPIDWGFYPFSVPEFTENVMINHFIRGNLQQNNIIDGQVAKTLGGKEVVFHKNPSGSLTINGASIVKGDTTVTKGNIMFINEVLFVSESVVSRLHQQHKDKETPPLLAFPWFGAQFLSHAFLALERDKRFTHITRFLNLADLAPHVSGTGYTFFVPVDAAFEQLGLDKMPDNYLSTGDGLQILLNHFLKGRLYDRDLKNNSHFQTLGNKTIHVLRNKGVGVLINDAHIVESEIFVYNLGTMFYIDKILFTSIESLPTATKFTVASSSSSSSTTTTTITTELIEELTEGNGDITTDLLLLGVTDKEKHSPTTTTNSLPLTFNHSTSSTSSITIK